METTEWIAATLTQAGIAAGVGDYPEGDTAASVAYAESEGPVGYLGTSACLERQTVRLTVRALTATEAAEKMRAAERALADVRPAAALVRVGGMEDAGKDAAGRAQLTMKFRHYQQRQ